MSAAWGQRTPTLHSGQPPSSRLSPSFRVGCTGNPVAYPRENLTGRVTYQTTVGWSLISSGIVTLLLNVLPGDSIWWGLGLLVSGLAVLYVRRDDVRDAIEPLT